MRNENNKYSAIVIGSGCLGASVFRSLKLKGVSKVLLIDKKKAGEGISALSGGMVRVFHRKAKDRMASKYSQNVFYNLEREIGLNISKVGSLSIVSEEDIRDININDFEIINYENLKERFPQFNFSDNEIGVYEKNGASICVKEYIEKVIAHYKTEHDDLIEDTYVSKIDSSSKGIHKVITTSGTFHSSRVIVTSGIGLKEILPEIYEDECIEQREITAYKVQTKDAKSIPNFFDYTTIFYGSKNFQGEKGNFRVGVQSGTKNPIEKVREYSKKRFSLDYEITEEKVSANDLYTKNRDGFLGKVCGRDGLFVLAGWGGGAFKFAPFLGHKIVEEVINKREVIGGSYEITI